MDPVALRRTADATETLRANRSWWDAQAADYYVEHGEFLGDRDFVWGPEGLREADARLLGEVSGRRVLEIGGGAAQCGRWLQAQGAHVVSTDLSAGMLAQSRRIDPTGSLPLVQCDGSVLPFADATFDLVCTAYGVLPFVADVDPVLREVARVLRPGGRFVASTTHPFRWSLPDDPGPDGLVVRFSYFERTPYVEQDGAGTAGYVEHHRTVGDWVRACTAAGLQVRDLVEPEWPEGHAQVWGGWSPLRGELVPGTLILVTVRS